jgi:erythromycin esterase-like protein
LTVIGAAARRAMPAVVAELRARAHRLRAEANWSRLLELIGDARIVLLGESTHGTHEFYRARAEISRRLILERGFDALAVEADWPDALRVSRYIQNVDDDRTATAALGGFQRFPLWLWRNAETIELATWLRRHNDSLALDRRIGWFGLDIYSLRASMDAVVRYLAAVDPPAAARARSRYGCFDHLAETPQQYGRAASFGLQRSCEDAVVQQLIELAGAGVHSLRDDDHAAADDLFYAQQNARVVRSAEAFYRTLFQSRDESWNVRDRHMADTLTALCDHLAERRGRPAKLIVWAHNAHIGDARATAMGERGELNLGQLVRERFGAARCFLLGFTTHAGTVAAASGWDAPAELKILRPSLADSFEQLCHGTGLGKFLLPLRGDPALAEALAEPRLQRAVGVVYLPETERASHYFHARVAQQFDAVVHFDSSRALTPLDAYAHRRRGQDWETYPAGV